MQILGFPAGRDVAKRAYSKIRLEFTQLDTTKINNCQYLFVGYYSKRGAAERRGAADSERPDPSLAKGRAPKNSKAGPPAGASMGSKPCKPDFDG